jgi:hypothetical protein
MQSQTKEGLEKKKSYLCECGGVSTLGKWGHTYTGMGHFGYDKQKKKKKETDALCEDTSPCPMHLKHLSILTINRARCDNHDQQDLRHGLTDTLPNTERLVYIYICKDGDRTYIRIGT